MTTRKPKPTTPAPRRTVAVRLTEAEYAALSDLAEADHRSMSQYMELLLLRHLAEAKKPTRK